MYPVSRMTSPPSPSLVLFLLVSFPPLSSFSSLFTSCTLTGEQPWNVNRVSTHLRSWLRSVVTVLEDNEDKIESKLYNQELDEFVEHIAGWNGRDELDEDGEEWVENRKVVTIARLEFHFL